VNTTIIIWTVAIAAVFGFLWYRGDIRRFATYWQEMLEELKKCSWPTWTELKGSTMVIVVTIMIMGGLTYLIDLAFDTIFLKLIY